jgi:hypothetical protein
MYCPEADSMIRAGCDLGLASNDDDGHVTWQAIACEQGGAVSPGLREHKTSSLRVCVAECLPEDMREQTREIVGLESRNPRKGYATTLCGRCATKRTLPELP